MKQIDNGQDGGRGTALGGAWKGGKTGMCQSEQRREGERDERVRKHAAGDRGDEVCSRSV